MSTDAPVAVASEASAGQGRRLRPPGHRGAIRRRFRPRIGGRSPRQRVRAGGGDQPLRHPVVDVAETLEAPFLVLDDVDDTLDRLREHGAQLVDEVVQYEDVYRLCYVRGPEGILIGLAEQIG